MQLQDWFETKDYGDGLALLENFCKNRVMLQSLKRKPNPGKLAYELKKIATSHGVVPVKPELPELPESPALPLSLAVKQDGKTNVRAGVVINPDELPETLRARWHENNDLYKEIRATHEKLKLMENATDEDRAPLVQNIANWDDKIRTNWEVIDAWKPGDEPIIEKVLEIDHKRINANRKFISINLKTLSTIANEGKAAIIKAKIQERYTELKNAGEAVQPETIDELTKAGIQC